jgi:hypothetical protein
MKRWFLALSIALTVALSPLALPQQAQAAAPGHHRQTSHAVNNHLPILRSRYYYSSPDQRYTFSYSFDLTMHSPEYYLDAGTHDWVFSSYRYRDGYAMLVTFYLNDFPIGTVLLPESGGTVTVTGEAGYYSFVLQKPDDGFYVQGSVQNFWPLLWLHA